MSTQSSSRLYVVRRDGKVHFEGDLTSLRAWLADNRIRTDDEVRRQGFEVLEGERLWSLVKDRADLGFDPAAERENLRRLRKGNRALLAAGAVALFAGLTMLLINQVLPRYDAAEDIKLAQENGARLAAEDVNRLKEEIGVLRESLAATREELSAADKDKGFASVANSNSRMVSLVDKSPDSPVSVVPLYEWISSTGIGVTLSEDRKSLRLNESGGVITCTGSADTGIFLNYTKRFNYSHSRDDFADFLTANFLVNTLIRSGKVVIVGDGEIEYRFSSVVAPVTPATVLETFLLECKLGSASAQGGLKQFLR